MAVAVDGPGSGHYPSSPPSFVDRGDGRLPSGGTHWPAAGQRELFPLPYASSPLRKPGAPSNVRAEFVGGSTT